MGAKVNLTNELESVSFGLDNVVIRRLGGAILGGRALDVTDFAEDVIKAGHVVIQNTTDETIYKPMPVSGGKYATLPEGYRYAGVVVSSVLKTKAAVSIMYDGEVNDVASPYPVDTIKAALKEALPTLVFLHD